MFNKRPGDITLEDLEIYLGNLGGESITVEFKEEFYKPNDEGKKELCKDATAFANTKGGVLVYGVAERQVDGKTEKTYSLAPLRGTTKEQLIQRFQSTIDAHVQPRIHVEYGSIHVPNENEGDGLVFVAKIAASIEPPHVVKFHESTKFFTRTAHGAAPITDIYELRQAFLSSAVLEERIRDWKNLRLSKILSGETPVALHDSACLALHLVPVHNFIRRIPVDIPVDPQNPILAFGEWTNPRVNFEGQVFPILSGRPCSAYVQVFRHGMIEAVHSSMVSVDPNTESRFRRFVRTPYAQKAIADQIPILSRRMISLGASLPIIAFATLLNVGETYPVGIEPWLLEDKQPNLHGNLLLPEIIIHEVEEGMAGLLEPVILSLWNAYGYSEVPNFR